MNENYTNLSNLKPDEIEMLERARKVSYRAYNIYSNFFVGACVKSSTNNLFTGTFLENVSFGMTVCAEVSALLSALNHGEISIRKVAVVGGSDHNIIAHPITPCGRCRQVLSEFAFLSNKNIKIICSDLTLNSILITSIEELLPEPFSPSNPGISQNVIKFKERIKKTFES